MITEKVTIPASDGRDIPLFIWIPDSETSVKGILQISHGLAEHAKRYERFASFLTEKGFAVFANDHRGHGPKAAEDGTLGFFAGKNGWDLVVDDLLSVTLYIKKRFSGAPLFLLGHSMGSFLARTYLIKHSDELAGAVISGTAGNPGVLGPAGRVIAALERLFRGKQHKSTLLDGLSFSGNNKSFQPARTNFDWISRDETEVDLYVADPLCGFISTTGLFQDMLYGLSVVSSDRFFQSIPPQFPIFLLSGSKDPVGNFGKGVTEVYEKLKNAGVEDVKITLYPQGRHEMLNEVNRDQVYNDIYEWLAVHLKS